MDGGAIQFKKFEDGEGFGPLGGGWLGHALLLQCLGNAFKLILAEGGLGLPIAADGVRP